MFHCDYRIMKTSVLQSSVSLQLSVVLPHPIHSPRLTSIVFCTELIVGGRGVGVSKHFLKAHGGTDAEG